MNKHLALDFGNVVCSVNMRLFIEKIAEHSQIEYEEAYIICEAAQSKIDLGIHSVMSAYKHVMDPAHIAPYWDDVISEVKEIDDVILELENNGVKIAFLSNIGVDHGERISKIPYVDRNIKHFSHEVGARKPAKIYFQSFLMEYPEFKGCLFLDDRAENVNSASKYFTSKQFAIDSFETKQLAAKAFRDIMVEEGYL